MERHSRVVHTAHGIAYICDHCRKGIFHSDLSSCLVCHPRRVAQAMAPLGTRFPPHRTAHDTIATLHSGVCVAGAPFFAPCAKGGAFAAFALSFRKHSDASAVLGQLRFSVMSCYRRFSLLAAAPSRDTRVQALGEIRDRQERIPRGCRTAGRKPERKSGAPGGIRTPDPLLRRQTLFPTELRARCP